MIFLFPMNFLISFEICSTQRLSKSIISLPFTCKAIQGVSIDLNSSNLLHMPHLLFWVNYLLNKRH